MHFPIQLNKPRARTEKSQRQVSMVPQPFIFPQTKKHHNYHGSWMLWDWAVVSNIGLQTLKESRDCICKTKFNNMKAHTHKLHHLLSGEIHVNYEMR